MADATLTHVNPIEARHDESRSLDSGVTVTVTAVAEHADGDLVDGDLVDDDLVDDELLIEEISIDGMCGVY